MGNNKNVFIRTYGCKLSQYEAQQIREFLTADGYNLVQNINQANILVISSCTVTIAADNECLRLINKTFKENPNIEIYLAGCYAKKAKGSHNFPKEVKLFDEYFPQIKELNKNITSFDGHTRAFIKVQDGCDNFCTYCIVPFVRSKLTSKPIESVLREVSDLVKNGYPEIVLSGVRLGKYAGGLEKLLNVLSKLPGNFLVRLSSLEVTDVSPQLINIIAKNTNRFCQHFHLPLQSGSDTILKRMNRRYNSKEFINKIAKIRAQLPDVSITSDVIVGFPGETQENFEQTLNVVQKAAFSRLHVFTYSKRPGTAAASFSECVAIDVAKKRYVKLKEVGKTLSELYWRGFVGKVLPAVFENGKYFLTTNYIKALNIGPVVQGKGPFKVLISEQNGVAVAELI